jgi:hypothetical protein
VLVCHDEGDRKHGAADREFGQVDLATDGCSAHALHRTRPAFVHHTRQPAALGQLGGEYAALRARVNEGVEGHAVEPAAHVEHARAAEGGAQQRGAGGVGAVQVAHGGALNCALGQQPQHLWVEGVRLRALRQRPALLVRPARALDHRPQRGAGFCCDGLVQALVAVQQELHDGRIGSERGL